MDTQEFLSKIKDEGIEYVDIRFTDTRGALQHVTIVSDLVDEDFLEEGFVRGVLIDFLSIRFAF